MDLMWELFQECRRGNVLIGTLRLDKDVSFKRSKLIIKYTSSRCCSKDIFAASTSRSPTKPPPAPSRLYFLFFLPEVEKKGRKSHLHQAKLCWAALSVEKTWGFDSSHSMVINYFSTVVGLLSSPILFSSSPLSAVVVEVEVQPGGWRQHMISAALITGLTGKRPRQQ